MLANRSILFGLAVALTSPSATGCLATAGVLEGQRVAGSLANVKSSRVEAQILASERSVVRTAHASADAQGILLSVEARDVCPNAHLLNDTFVAENPPRVGILVGTALLDAALGAAAVWGVGSLGASNPDLSPSDVAAQMNAGVVVAGGVLGGGLLALIYPFTAGKREFPRTEYHDAWCGEWTPVPEVGWKVVTTTEKVAATAVDPLEAWVATTAQLSAREAQLQGKMAQGLPRRTGTLNPNPEGSVILREPKPPRGFEGVARHLWDFHVRTGTPLVAAGRMWRVPASTLAPLAWTRVILDSGGRMPDRLPGPRSVLVVHGVNADSGGASTLAVREQDLKDYSAVWACETADSSESDDWLAMQTNDVAARAISLLQSACASRVANLKQKACGRFAPEAGLVVLPDPSFIAPLTMLCGPEEWNRTVWRVFDGAVADGSWERAQNLLDLHGHLLAARDPKGDGESTGESAVAQAQRVVSEGRAESDRMIAEDLISDALQRAQAAVSPGEDESPDVDAALAALTELTPHIAAHAEGFPIRASWLVAQRKAATAVSGTLVDSSLKEENWDTARSQVESLTPLLGEPWAKAMSTKVDKSEATATARYEAQQRREERAESCVEDRCRSWTRCTDEVSFDYNYRIVSITDRCRWIMGCQGRDLSDTFKCYETKHASCVRGCGGTP